MNYEITTGAQTVTATGAVTGSLSTSALSGDFTVKVDVLGLTAGATARIAVEDTSAGFGTDHSQVAVFDVSGPIGTAESVVAPPDVNYSKRAYEVPSTRFGATNAALRVNVLVLSGSSPSLTVHAFLQQ
jgi:hypothetical protein